jgi:hypothetical protein
MNNVERYNEWTNNDEVLRLKTENKLLRAASEEQRKLNGQLRASIQSSDTSLAALTIFLHWFNTWGIMLDGTCYDEVVEVVTKCKTIPYFQANEALK